MKASHLYKGLIIIFYAFLAALTSCSFTQKRSLKLYNIAKHETYDIIVVPGVPFEGEEWSRTMKGRVLWATHLYNKGVTKNIIFSGSAVYSPYPEAEIMAKYAKALGVPKEHVFTETKAEHSTENMYYSYKKAKKLGFKKIALASDPFQTKMLRKFAHKRLSPNVGMIPIVFDTLAVVEAREPSHPTIDFQSVFVENFVPLDEREGFWKRLKGTRGQNLDTTVYQ